MNILKSLSYKVLCNDLSGSIIRSVFGKKIPDIRWKHYHFDTTGSGMRSSIVASIFWGFYEAAEIRFVEKYFKAGNDVIELGASSGIVSSHIISRLSGSNRLISVEANKNLANAWTTNTSRHNKNKVQSILLNCAIHYDAPQVRFTISDNTTESHIGNDSQPLSEAVTIEARKLSELITDFKVSRYCLFCDIEGAEIDVLINDPSALDNCSSILIELHASQYRQTRYDVEQIKDMILSKGFHLIDRHGNVFYFER